MYFNKGDMMSRYKVIKTGNGFSVWKLKDFGCGYSYEDTKNIFSSKEEAQKYIESEVNDNDSNGKSTRNTEKT